jgi:thioredoxin reductase
MFTKHLLSFETVAGLLPMKKPLVIGSDVIAYAAAAKLKRAGAADAVIVDNRKSPECPIHERAYFRLFGKFPYRGSRADSIEIRGTKSAEGADFEGKTFNSDGIVISGELVPNSELALLSDLKVNIPSRVPVVGNDSRLSEPGWFIAGNVRGGFHGGEWCFFDGQRAARAVLKSM